MIRGMDTDCTHTLPAIGTRVSVRAHVTTQGHSRIGYVIDHAGTDAVVSMDDGQTARYTATELQWDTDCTPRDTYTLAVYLVNQHREILVSDACLHHDYSTEYGTSCYFVLSTEDRVRWLNGVAYLPSTNVVDPFYTEVS